MPEKSQSEILEQKELHLTFDPHARGSSLSDVILGGQDGLVNVLGVILGVAAATSDTVIVLVAGLAAAVAESVSMGAVAYTSTVADADYYESERAREYRHVEEIPQLEKDEIRAIYAKKGFKGDLLDHIVDTITANQDIWVAVMMAEEHRLSPVDRRSAVKAAFVVGFSAIIGSLIPLVPFLFLPIVPSMILSVVLTAGVLFGVGVYKARVMVGHPVKSGLELALIGTLSALAGYAIGMIFKTTSTP
jgi:VIT1/CCC1 family predicted Fe2+/Mn2+ transporter